MRAFSWSLMVNYFIEENGILTWKYSQNSWDDEYFDQNFEYFPFAKIITQKSNCEMAKGETNEKYNFDPIEMLAWVTQFFKSIKQSDIQWCL